MKKMLLSLCLSFVATLMFAQKQTPISVKLTIDGDVINNVETFNFRIYLCGTTDTLVVDQNGFCVPDKFISEMNSILIKFDDKSVDLYNKENAKKIETPDYIFDLMQPDFASLFNAPLWVVEIDTPPYSFDVNSTEYAIFFKNLSTEEIANTSFLSFIVGLNINQKLLR